MSFAYFWHLLYEKGFSWVLPWANKATIWALVHLHQLPIPSSVFFCLGVTANSVGMSIRCFPRIFFTFNELYFWVCTSVCRFWADIGLPVRLGLFRYLRKQFHKYYFWLVHRYDPSTGIYGMDFYVVLERPGYRVGRRRRCKSRVGLQHRVTKEDAMKWFQVKYEGVILNKAQATTW